MTDKSREGLTANRNPFLSVSLPRSFVRENPQAAAALAVNQMRTVTMYDVYTAIRQVGAIGNAGGRQRIQPLSTSELPYIPPKARSIFEEIDTKRNCYDIGIQDACICMEPQEITHIYKANGDYEEKTKEIAKKTKEIAKKTAKKTATKKIAKKDDVKNNQTLDQSNRDGSVATACTKMGCEQQPHDNHNTSGGKETIRPGPLPIQDSSTTSSHILKRRHEKGLSNLGLYVYEVVAVACICFFAGLVAGQRIRLNRMLTRTQRVRAIGVASSSWNAQASC